MSKLANPIRPLLVLAALVAVALPASGCGTTTADPERGRVLFVEKCGVCHAMAQAGTTAQVGPNLDDAFASAREAGENSRTVEGVVKAQVESPRPVTNNTAVSMPPDITRAALAGCHQLTWWAARSSRVMRVGEAGVPPPMTP